MKAAARLTTLAVLCFSLAMAAAAVSNPKATGNAHWIDPYSRQPANLSFNVVASSKAGPIAKGSATYTDQNVTYTINVQFLKVSGNRAWFGASNIRDGSGWVSRMLQSRRLDLLQDRRW